MDVNCERCKAEYDFDDSLLGEHGTTVKCSSCGHVFRVIPATKQTSRSALRVRYKRDGRVEVVGTLRDLQRRVQAGQVSIHDELGRDGFPFRRLSDVPELGSFFTMAGGSAMPPPAADAARSLAAISVNQSSRPAPPTDKNGASKAARTLLGVGPLNPQIPGPPRVPNVPIPWAASSGETRDKAARPAPALNLASPSERPTDPPKHGDQTSGRPRSGPPVPPPNRAPQLYLSEHESMPARATEGSSRVWIAAALALGLVVVAAAKLSSVSEDEPDPDAEAPPTAGRIEAPAPASTIAAHADPNAPAHEDTTGLGGPTPTNELAAPNQPAGGNRPNAPEQAAPPTPETEPEAQPETEPQAQPEAQAETTPGAEGAKPASPGEKSRDPAGAGATNDYGSLVAQGDVALKRANASAAEQAYTQALALRASGAEAATGLGYALVAGGRPQEALPYFGRAAKNGYAEASIGLGDAYKKLGDSEAARKAYKSYLERLPSGSRAKYAKKQLAALGGATEPSAGDPEPPRPSGEPRPAADSDYRPAGELIDPPAGEGATP